MMGTASTQKDKMVKMKAAIRTWLHNTSFETFASTIEKQIIGQKELRPLLFIIYNYLECIVYGRPIKHNVILAGPSGCGKTELFRALREYFSKEIGLSVTCSDLSNITTTGFKGAEPNSILQPYASGDNCCGYGIIFLDEFDKRLIPQYAGSGSNQSNVSVEVQNSLLKIVEGANVTFDKSASVDTENLCFIAMGSFAYVRKKRYEEEKVTSPIGFSRNEERDEIEKRKDPYLPIEKKDITENGATIELMARFPYVVNFSPLQEDALVTLIDKVRKDVEKTLVRAEIILEQPMIDFLKENCKTEYGVRYVDDLVRDRAIRAYMEAMSELADEFAEIDAMIHDGIKNQRFERLHLQ